VSLLSDNYIKNMNRASVLAPSSMNLQIMDLLRMLKGTLLQSLAANQDPTDDAGEGQPFDEVRRWMRLIKLVEEAIFARTENALSVSEMIATPLLRDLYFRRTGLNILVEVEMEVQNLYFRRTGLDLRVNVEKQSLGQCSLYDRWRAACGLPSR
jgi:hypothetical protein